MRLLLVLALLGAVAGGPRFLGAQEPERPTKQGSGALQEEPVGSVSPCRGEGWGFGARGAWPRWYRYILVNEAQTFEEATKTCAQKHRGFLASIHSNKMNSQLSHMAKVDQVWVGGIISSLGGRPSKCWVDGSPWNYFNWANGNPSRNGKTCVALCTKGGHWKTISCNHRLPFICEIPSGFI